MDFLDVMSLLGLSVSTFVIYRLILYEPWERRDKTKGHYTRPAWNFHLKRIFAEYKVCQKQKADKLKYVTSDYKYDTEAPKILVNEESSDSQMINGYDDEGNSILIKFTRRRHRIAEVWLLLRLANGEAYSLPNHPNTTIVNATPRTFEGAGLKLECLIPFRKWRITYSGMLRRGISLTDDSSDEGLFYSKINFFWVAASNPKFWPFDWSAKLIATSLATEKWRDGKWMDLMTKKDSGGYDLFGACHGLLKIYENDSKAYVDGLLPESRNFELNLPGLRQRRWGPYKNDHLHRTGVLIGSIKDGIVFEVGAMSGKTGLTHTQFGNIRFPAGQVFPIEWTDFNLAALGEEQNHLPEATIVQMKAQGKDFIAMVTFKNHQKVPLYGGSSKESWNAFIIPIDITFNTYKGHGSAIFWYPKNINEFDIQEIPAKIKRIFNRHDKPSPEKLVVSFADKEAQSVAVSGGKGASLAILRVIQETKGSGFLDKRNRSQQILNALIDTVSSNPLKRSIRVQSLMESDSEPKVRGRQRAGSIVKEIFPDPHEFEFPEFHVAQGFIVSVSAFERHLKSHPAITEALKDLENVAYERSAGSLEEACKRVQEAFKATKLDSATSESVSAKLKPINFDGGARFAVRSSGITEDCEDSSAAGQNETFLGLKTDEDVFLAVAKCWASLYTFQSVQYRKQHIQPVRTSMAVVVQKMVDAEAAGVLFTRHPINGDSSITIITANFGLGESVVSAKSEPDTFYLKRSFKDDVEYLGAKTGMKKTITEMDSNAAIQEVELSDERRTALCLSEETCLKLGKLGVIMEKFFGTARDLEFAVTSDDKIYMLQSRPITALNNFSDYEIIHENDYPVMSADDCNTRANVGEVILGPSSVFSQAALGEVMQDLIGEFFIGSKVETKNNCEMSFFSYFQHQLFMNMRTLYLSNIKGEPKIFDRVGASGIFGFDVYERYPQLVEIAKHQKIVETASTMAQLTMMYTAVFQIKKIMTEQEETCERMKILYHKQNVEKLILPIDILNFAEKGIDEHCKTVTKCHMVASNSSIITQLFAFNALLGNSKTFTVDHQSDIALILGSISDVESANVPEMIGEISGQILMSGKHKEFIDIDSKQAIDWMKNNCSNAHQHFEAFMKRHGHRGINELDYISTPWEDEPELIIEMIKTNLRASDQTASSHTKKSTLSDEEILEILKSPLGTIAKFMMRKFLLPRCKKGVQNREYSKSKMVFACNKIRKVMKYLAEKMVHEGLLPDRSLIFHMSKGEIRDLITTRDARIVQKAIRRQKLFPNLKETNFGVLSFGVPRPLEAARANENASKGDVLVRGVPICGGVVTAKACVCKSFADANKLEKGDILITFGTDIAWSPYFPMLSGVCTEIGGLVSHGAVVAREYGLPCLVGATFASDLITDGQIITLDAEKGTISAT